MRISILARNVRGTLFASVVQLLPAIFICLCFCSTALSLSLNRIHKTKYQCGARPYDSLIKVHDSTRLSKRNFVNTLTVKMAVINEFEDDNKDDVTTSRTMTDMEAGKTHGYEGDFKVGDIVRVKKSMKIWSVKPYTETGFDPQGFQGKVKELVLYGRKMKSLCSAITPIKVEFEPTDVGIPSGMFQKKWSAHFAAEELDLISKAPPQTD